MTECNTTHLLMKQDLQSFDNLLPDHEIKKYYKEAVKHTLCNFAGTKNISIIYEAKPLSADLIGFTNSNFIADTNNKRFMSGFLFMLNNACIHWQSK